MNANVGFLAPASSGEEAPRRATVTIPPSAVRNGAVYLLVNGRAVSQPVEVGRTTARGAEILAGLSGGEDVIVSPPEDLADGDPVRRKGA